MSLAPWLRSLLVLAWLVPSVARAQDEEAQPTTPPPTSMPPAPPVSAPPQAPPPEYGQPYAAPPVAPAPSSGQWVFTQQYGWLWMPYSQRYTIVDQGTGSAQMFVFRPRFGWRWLAAPWVMGLGPLPFWGRVGPARFAWYAHPWFRPRAYYRWHGGRWGRSPGWHGGWHGGGWHGGGWHGGGWHGERHHHH